MSKNEAKWLGLFLFGFALTGIDRGWKQVCWNVGMGIVGWCIGRALRA